SVPFGDNNNGRVYIFQGGAAFGSITGPASAAVTVGVAAGTPGNYFHFGGLGWSLAAARFDGDARDDLIMSVPGGGGGNGGVAVLFGGTTTTSIALSSLDASGSGTATTLVIQDPQPANFDFFGQWLFNLGRTEGAGDLDDDIG